MSLSTNGRAERTLLLTAPGLGFRENGEPGSLSLRPSTAVRSLFKRNSATACTQHRAFLSTGV